MAALHDHDCYEGMEAGQYLERSASAMRASIVSGVPVAHNNIDKHIRLVLTDKGPEYWSLSKLKGGSVPCRRVGNLYYTHKFGEIVFKEMLMNRSKVKAMLPRLLMRSTESGSKLGNLYPTAVRHWWPLVEDVFTSPQVCALQRKLQDELIDHDELECISIDATLRCCLRIVGQASYRASAATRAQAAFDDQHAKRRVLTMRGRTSATIGMWPIQEESTKCVVEEIIKQLPIRLCLSP